MKKTQKCKNIYLAKTKRWIVLLLWTTFSGVTNISKKIANFLTILRKFGYHCVYVFHVILPSTQI